MDLMFFDERDSLNLRMSVEDMIETVPSISLKTSVMKSTIETILRSCNL